MDVALQTLSDPFTLVLAWGAGACGWALCQVLPVILRTVWNAQEAAQIRAIQAELVSMRDEWDLPA